MENLVEEIQHPQVKPGDVVFFKVNCHYVKQVTCS